MLMEYYSTIEREKLFCNSLNGTGRIMQSENSMLVLGKQEKQSNINQTKTNSWT